ncbi:type I-E CRISPR-associated protein Cse1/CasA [Streptomyces spiramenti]|uniref:type I-E CRISPR-associated protein Cse1/CasA n=1 Tax=Streptomyces spiramenti TaxID=2720606 RepID=UPI001ADDE4D9
MTATTGGSAAPFDLTTEPWLPVLRTDGTFATVSLTGVFREAATIRRLVGDLPTQDMALLRLLLAALHDALDGPGSIDDWFELWHAEDPFAPVLPYLEAHRHRFDLFHPEQPFFQVAGLRTGSDEASALNRIVADVPNGEAFFSMRKPGASTLTPAEAARWLVHAHAFDTSGIKSGMVGDPRAKGGKVYPLGVGSAGELGGVHAEGESLRETLLLNLVPREELGFEPSALDSTPDAPAWRLPPNGPGGAAKGGGDRFPRGLRDLYTWQTRRVRLVAEESRVTGVVLGYGDPLKAAAPWKLEPMTGWRRSPTQEKKQKLPLVYMPRHHDPARAAWRGLEALLPSTAVPSGRRQESDGADHLPSGVVRWLRLLAVEAKFEPARGMLRLRTVGAVYGTQQSVIDEMVDDSVLLPILLLDCVPTEDRPEPPGREHAMTALAAVKDADQAVRALGNLAGNLARAVGSSPDGPTATARDLGYGALDGPFRAWLAGLGDVEDPEEQARPAWQAIARQQMLRLGRPLLNTAGATASEGRWADVPGSGKRFVNDAQAELWFLRALRNHLPRAVPPRADDPPPGSASPRLPAPSTSPEQAGPHDPAGSSLSAADQEAAP